MENSDDDIPSVLDLNSLPFVLRHPKTTYWSGVLLPTIGLVVQSLGIPHAFVASGVALGFIVLALGMAARRCSQIAMFATNASRDALRKQAENRQASMNARNLMQKAHDSGDLQLLVELARTAEDCDSRDNEFLQAAEDTQSSASNFEHYDNELSEAAWAFGIVAGLVSSLGGFLNIPNL